MRHDLLAALVILEAVAAGCQPLPQDASRTYPPGRASDVAQGVTASGTVAGDALQAPRVLASSDLPAGIVPLVEPAEVVHIWFFPTVSRDGYAFREGFWCHRVIRTFAWGAARAQVERSVPLAGVENPDDEGGLGGNAFAGDGHGRIEPQAAFLDSVHDLGRELVPYAPVRTVDQPSRPKQPEGVPAPPTTSAHPSGH